MHTEQLAMTKKRNIKKKRSGKQHMKSLHKYYSYTGFYSFLRLSILKSIIPIVLVVGALFYVHYFVIDFKELIGLISDRYAAWAVMLFFFISESLLGLIPPELFIAWSKMTQYPFLNLGILASLSYLGGVVSYGIGLMILKIPSVHRYIEVKMQKNIKQAKKWGGFLVAAGALLPIPFSITSMAAGIIRYNFNEFLLFALLRYVRFVIYAIAIYGIVK